MAHKVEVVCEGQRIDGWITYTITRSMIAPTGRFSLTRPFSNLAWVSLRRDARLTILIDNTPVLTGRVVRRRKVTKEHAMEISGLSLYARIVEESAPTIAYEKLKMLEAIQRLADPFIGSVLTSDATNRSLSRGKGRKVPAGNEPLVINLPVPKRGQVHPGTPRGTIIKDITSQAGYLVWETSDGKAIVVGKPNYRQAAQFTACNAKTGSSNRTTCKDLELVEDNGDRFSMVVVAGAGSGDLANYGNNVTSRSARALDSELGEDGTGRDFLVPKRLQIAERDFDTVNDGMRVADREMARRDFIRDSIVAPMKDHGQVIAGSTVPTIYAFNTIVRVIDEDFEPTFDENYLIHTLTFDGARQEQTTRLEMVPVGTEIVP